MKTLALLIALGFSTVMVGAKELDRCPGKTAQELAAAAAVDLQIGGYVEARNVALGFMKGSDGNSLGPLITQDDIDKKRTALANIELWAMTLTDAQSKNDYLCAILSRRRGLESAALELVDHQVQKELEHPSQPNGLLQPPAK